MKNIAITTFRELFRNRILSLIILFTLVLIGFSQVLASLSLWQTNRIILDFGLAMMELSGLIATVFIGGQILFKEIEGKTIYLILSKPIARRDFILWKFIGFATMMKLILILQAAVLLGLLYFQKIHIDPLVFVAIVAIVFKVLIVFAIILFFSTFSSPLLSICFTLGVYIAAHSLNGVLDMANRTQQVALLYGSKILLTILPNFEALNMAKNTIGTPVGFPATFYLTNFAMAFGYLAFILIVTAIIFEYKKFENA